MPATPMAAYRDLFSLAGRTALVLGAASGIGRESALALGALGAHVICADRDAAGAAAAANIISGEGSAEAHRCDASSLEDMTALAALVRARHPRLDVAVTTPGLNIRKTILDYTEDDFDRVVTLNLKGTFRFFRAFGRIMRDQGGGSLIACSSVRATTIEPGLGVYGMTKAGISLLVKGFAAEMGAHNVRVNAIAPSIIETALTAPIKERPEIYRTHAAHTALNRWGAASEVAAAVAFLAADASSYITGSTLLIDAGWTAIDGPPTGLTATRQN
jgi:NAD(P)-dependent dehydrogenase (short-subunit alcohol dehydrogenase family)